MGVSVDRVTTIIKSSTATATTVNTLLLLRVGLPTMTAESLTTQLETRSVFLISTSFPITESAMVESYKPVGNEVDPLLTYKGDCKKHIVYASLMRKIIEVFLYL